MEVTSVTSKGQVTIPKGVRQQLGIRKGSFGMLKSRRVAVPADLDPAALLKP
jgi:bifunctional DNA-binding transcriptional regulator/antitoxin component of YhaV-PrlF toxin-antitoxin module